MKKEIDFGVNFHQTFPPTPAYIGRILAIAEGKKMSSREISDLTGIPQGESSGKVVPHLKYAAYMGLIEPDVTIPTRTPLGDIVLQEDRSCSEALTQWLMHSNLTSSTGAPMWHFLIRELLFQNREGTTKEYLSMQMQAVFKTEKYTPVLTTYNEFSSMTYLSVDKPTGKVSIFPQRIERELLYLYGYSLMHEWDARFPSTPEITVYEMNGFACVTCFGFTDNQWFDVLEQLSALEIIRMNKQLSPYTIVHLTSAQTLVPKLYSLLI
ncbi:MAG: hypothetical protein PHI98_03940 [Eubacteriales bacterium]|nr:hypothetical protein [Eubacteriales bacterium]